MKQKQIHFYTKRGFNCLTFSIELGYRFVVFEAEPYLKTRVMEVAFNNVGAPDWNLTENEFHYTFFFWEFSEVFRTPF